MVHTHRYSHTHIDALKVSSELVFTQNSHVKMRCIIENYLLGSSFSTHIHTHAHTLTPINIDTCSYLSD